MSVAAVVNSTVRDSCETVDGARWLASYIDPAHGNCQTVPDEDNNPSICLRSNFNVTIDKDFFVAPNISDGPTDLDFSIFLTPWPEYPLMVIGTFYYMSSSNPTKSERCVLIPDANVLAFMSGGAQAGVSEVRAMYKGATMHYTGNQYNNEGSITAASVVIAHEDVANSTSGAAGSISRLWKTGHLPVGPDNISNASQQFSNIALPNGIYLVQQYTGTRSEYAGPLTNTLDPIPAYVGTINWNSVFDYDNRFSASSVAPVINWGCNLNFVCAAIDSMNAAQSVLLRVYAGWQCHYTYQSGYTVLETHKSYLDMPAITLASQINSGLTSIYPASYNDFRKVWNHVYGFLTSKRAHRVVDAIGTLGGAWTAGANLYKSIF